MAYKVLNNVLVKDASNISSLSTDMLVLVINKNTKNKISGIIPVHIFGYQCKIDEILLVSGLTITLVKLKSP